MRSRPETKWLDDVLLYNGNGFLQRIGVVVQDSRFTEEEVRTASCLHFLLSVRLLTISTEVFQMLYVSTYLAVYPGRGRGSAKRQPVSI